MKRLLFILLLGPAVLWAQLEVVPEKEQTFVFAGEQKISVTFRNPLDKNVKSSLRTRLYQASSATLMPVEEAKPWKTLEMLAGQTIIESFTVNLPAVREKTAFQIRWLADTNQEIGKTTLQVFPDDLLKQLSTLAGENSIGVLDPENLLKPALQKCKVEFQDLENDAGFDGFSGKLAIVGPFSSKDSVPDNLKKRIETPRTNALAIVWIQPPSQRADSLLPVYLVRNGAGTVAIVQSTVVSDLAQSPQSQLNLLRCAHLVLHPDSLRLPQNENSP